MKKTLLILLAGMQVVACSYTPKATPQKTSESTQSISVPTFSSDSAYQYIQAQVDFGPRIPNSEAQKKCALYLESMLKRFGASVVIQDVNVKAFDGKSLRCMNLIGSFNTQASSRVVLFSHWDSRPWADNDPDPKNHSKPVMGANDGASGVGVLLEMARQFQLQSPTIGVDIIFFDVEDYGAPASYSGQTSEDTWCLGTQYWAANPHVQGYTANYGILLDMVGGKIATFMREDISDHFAPAVVDKVWSQAQSLGFSQYFVNQKGGAITDDHLYVNQLRGIPSIDIIQYSTKQGEGFASYWHTIHDTMESVDKNTLQAVGTTLLHVIYNEK